ncbi:MAG: hypothetical protein KatS3mg044_1520 [Rhodothermaceae bacterium]|nr:MAG: PorT family protein [Bacteroidota bacterium]GIV62654.1 MAG: hypothetical protein KatS3mg044_1520 [Rhodothermaceae bacterium]
MNVACLRPTRLLLPALLTVLLAPRSWAQEIAPTFKIGLSTATLSGTSPFDFEPYTGFAGGLGFNFALRNGFSIQPEIIYVVKGTRLDFDVRSTFDTILISPPGQDPEGVPATGTLRLTYAEIPLLLHYGFETRSRLHPRLFAGPALSYLLDARFAWAPRDGGVEQEQAEDNIESTDFGLVLGAGIEYDLYGERLLFEIRLSRGFSNTNFGNASANDRTLTNTSVMFLVGVAF